jgi:hypothetical protein
LNNGHKSDDNNNKERDGVGLDGIAKWLILAIQEFFLELS